MLLGMACLHGYLRRSFICFVKTVKLVSMLASLFLFRPLRTGKKLELIVVYLRELDQWQTLFGPGHALTK
jgi:hypothetical protein